MARGFNYSKFSLYLFLYSPTLTALLASFCWLFIHFIWIDQISTYWFYICLTITFISTTFYYSIIQQNYNIVGWIFFPMALFGLITGNWIIASLALFKNILFQIIKSL